VQPAPKPSPPAADRPPDPPRARDATRTRAALLNAGRELFAQRGFDRTTLRDVGSRAGVDPSLIARYFGNKTAFFRAVLQSEGGPDTFDGRPSRLAARVLGHAEEHGPSSVVEAVFAGDVDGAIREAVLERLEGPVLGPVERALREAGAGDARLRAEVAVALVLGLVVARSRGVLQALSAADAKRVLEIVGPALDALGGEAADGGRDGVERG
jgi:AcrR family transcriptional regulator